MPWTQRQGGGRLGIPSGSSHTVEYYSGINSTEASTPHGGLGATEPIAKDQTGWTPRKEILRAGESRHRK